MRILSALFATIMIFSAFKAEKTFISGTPLYAMLNGANETPTMGDPDGNGTAMLRLNQGQGTISYELYTEDIETAMAAHIHLGVAGTNGPVVVTLPVTGNMSTGVVEVDAELIKAIRQNPSGYYVNVHNASFPSGAIRGQLGK